MSRINPQGHDVPEAKEADQLERSKLVAYVLAAWLLIEVVAFVLVVQILGLVAAIALGVGTTLLGLADVKRLIAYVKMRFARSKEKQAPANMVDGALQAFGALLLILPGFASDLVGLALKAPSIRAGVVERIRNRDGSRGPRTIDLHPNEWKQIDDRKSRPRRPRKPKTQAAAPAPIDAAPDPQSPA